jgi:ribosome-binding protein aMBF1 (putative translation factor)
LDISMSDDIKAFAAYVRGCRAILGWSQSDLGRRVNLSQRAIHRIEAGTVTARDSSAEAIESAFSAAGITTIQTRGSSFRLAVKPKAWLPKKSRR